MRSFVSCSDRSLPPAEIVCEEPATPPEVLSVVTSGLRVGDTATYNCGKGREMLGERVRTCLNTGQWGGGVPTCQCEYRGKVGNPWGTFGEC